MEITLPLERMTVAEKIQTMENLWNDLCKHSANIPSPEWHREILLKREEAINDHTEDFSDWETAKQKIIEKLK